MKLLFLLASLAVAAYSSVIIDSRSPVAAADEDEWWKGGVFYQIYPRSFKDSDGDGEGDIKGITSKLQHLKDLGVTGAWLSPVFKSPMKDGGYDIESFVEINPRFGTNEDLEELFAKAKELGLKIILDFVPNHTSDQHEWFKKSVDSVPGFEDFYVWRDCPMVAEERRYPNNWIAVFHTRAWTYNEKRDKCYLHQFLAGQPDLNYRNPDVVEEMKKVLVFWLDRGVDGFRIDAINHMFETIGEPNEPYIDENGDRLLYSNLNHIHTMDLQDSYEMIFDWRKILDDYAIEKATTKKLMMTEAYATLENQLRWYGSLSRPGSHMPFNFALISDLNKDSRAADFKRAVDLWLNEIPSFGEGNWVLGNHDRSRIGYRYGENRHESLVVMTMLLPGINVVYYGEEILMTDNLAITWEETDDPQACQTNSTVYQEFTRDPVRTPFQWDNTKNAGFTDGDRTWLPVNANYLTTNLKAQTEASKSTFKLYQHLIQLRKSEIFKNGNYASKEIDQDLFAYTRTLEGHSPVVVFINLGVSRTVTVNSLLDDEDIPSGAQGKILVVTNDSPYRTNDFIVNPRRFELGRYAAIALSLEVDPTTTEAPPASTPSTTTAGSAAVIASFTVVMISLIMSYFN